MYLEFGRKCEQKSFVDHGVEGRLGWGILREREIPGCLRDEDVAVVVDLGDGAIEGPWQDLCGLDTSDVVISADNDEGVEAFH